MSGVPSIFRGFVILLNIFFLLENAVDQIISVLLILASLILIVPVYPAMSVVVSTDAIKSLPLTLGSTVVEMAFLVAERCPIDFTPPVTPLNFVFRLLSTRTQLMFGHFHPFSGVDSG
jgi:hypothetical protein